MNRIGTPLNIGILLHIHVSPTAVPRPQSAGTQETMAFLIAMGAIMKDSRTESGYSTTPLGAAWVKALLNVACPTPVFMDEHGRVIE